MKKQQSIFLLFITFLCTNIYAQTPKSFPEDDLGFINTLSTYISSNNRPEAKEIGTWLKTNLAVKISPEDLAEIKTTTNLMLQKKVTLWPAFYNYTNYLKTIGNQTNLDAAVITKNHQVLLKILQGNSPEAVKQFNFYVDYLTDHYQSKALYKDKVKSWFTTETYKIEIEDQFPVYVFPKMTLTGVTSTDSLEILETDGKFYPFTGLWKSTSGKITWKRVGFNAEDVFVTFKKYELDLAKPELNLDTVTFTFKPYVKNPIQGKFADKLFTSKSVAAAYPQFTSTDRVPLKVSDDIVLQSGIGLEGTKIFATTTGRAEPAKLTIYNSKKVKILESEAKKYLINNFRQINAEKSKVNFAFIDTNTSIFHPSSTLSYNIENKNLKITRENSNDARIPFVAPYFKMNLYVDQFDWNIDSNYADMNSTAVNAKLPTIFESFEYYIEGADSKYQQLLSIDPIGTLASYCESMGYSRLSIDEIARVWNASGYKAIDQLAFKMMEDGYLYYERETGMVDVYEKLFLHARIRKNPEDVNFDNIRLSSITQGKVGRLLLNQKKLQIFGTEKTRITSSVNVTMNPSSDTVYISENRGIVFKGRLSAGKFNFYSDSIQFNYEDYLFNLDNIDSMLVMVPTGQTDSKGNQYFTEINTPIEKISGKIYIADPKQRNKSTKYTHFPLFDCNDTSVVTFDKSKYGDSYSPENFKFKIYPFKLENLNNVDTDSLQFKGLLQSGGIFKDIETDLSITKDRTLGLDFNTGENGLAVYNQLGTITGDVKLDQDGLKSSGIITKGNIRFHSDDFLLLPDSLYAVLSKWEGVESSAMDYPVISGTEAKLSWMTENDSLSIEPLEKTDVPVYNNQALINGSFRIEGKLMSASGKFIIGESTIQADSIYLYPQKALVQQAPFAITSETYKVFSTPLADLDIDFSVSSALVKTPGDSLSRYHYNFLTTNNNIFNWNFKESTLTATDSIDSGNKYYEFVENKLKGIRLSAKSSVFDTKAKEIDLNGISQILVADSKIIPNGGKLKITDQGLIDILDSAVVILNTDSAFHTVTFAQVEIVDKDLMKGSGKLKVNIGNEEKEIYVENFKTIEEAFQEKSRKKDKRSTFYTVGQGLIEDTENFRLSDNLLYKGKLLFTSLNKEIQLDGFAQSQFKSIPESEWFKINQSLDLQKSSLKIDSLKNELGQDIYTGLMLDMNEFTIYPRVIQSKETSTDRPIYTASGYMKSNKKDNVILFGQEESFKKQNAFTPLMKFDDSTGTVDVVGNFPLIENTEPNTFNLFGSASYKKNDKTPFTIQGSLAMDLFVMEDIKNMLVRFMSDYNTSAVYTSLNKNKQHSFAITRHLKDPQTISLVTQDMEESSILNLPPNYPFNTVFSDVKFIYDHADGTFKSIAPLNMLVFGGRSFTQRINGYIEVGPRSKGDFFNIYLTTSSNDWIFIRYTNNELSIVSSDAQLNSNISSLKEDRRSIKSGKEVVYKIVITNPALKDNFVSRMEDFKNELQKP